MLRDEFGFPVVWDWPSIDAETMLEVDQLMVENYGISLPQMMENAGRALATVARDRYFGGNPAGRQVAVLVGPGGNGGGALTAARRLSSWGALVSIVLAQAPDRMTPVPGLQLAILKKMELRPVVEPGLMPDLILDGLVGYSLRGAPCGRVAELIGWANTIAAPVLSLDVPTGFNAASGVLCAPWIRADATVTLALPKRGMEEVAARGAIGALYLADISVPPLLYEQLSKPMVVPRFTAGDILRLAE